MKSLTLTPAYGRDYKSKAEVLEAWEANKDFRIATPFSSYSGTYLNRSQSADMRSDGFTELHIRYNRNEKILVQKI